MPQRMIYFNDELYTRLKQEANVSKLISTLLTDHFNKVDLNNMTLEELEKELKKAEILEQAKKDIKTIEENGN